MNEQPLENKYTIGEQTIVDLRNTLSQIFELSVIAQEEIEQDKPSAAHNTLDMIQNRHFICCNILEPLVNEVAQNPEGPRKIQIWGMKKDRGR